MLTSPRTSGAGSGIHLAFSQELEPSGYSGEGEGGGRGSGEGGGGEGECGEKGAGGGGGGKENTGTTAYTDKGDGSDGARPWAEEAGMATERLELK